MLCSVVNLGGKLFAVVPAEESAQLAYPPYGVGGHPPLRGTPEYPYGHPGYFNGTHASASPGYTGGATDTYGMYPGAGDRGVVAIL